MEGSEDVFDCIVRVGGGGPRRGTEDVGAGKAAEPG